MWQTIPQWKLLAMAHLMCCYEELFGLVNFETECSLAVSPRRTPADRPRDLTSYDFRVRVYSIKSIYSILTIPKRSSRIKGRDPNSEEHPEGVCKRVVVAWTLTTAFA